jgi:glycosyltransferase involved in cell wall biosynthesis
MKAPEISLVIPCHNEQDNLRPLLSAIHATMDPLGLDFEVVITDDCSTDN